jgi:hypothetical protein
MQQPFRQQAGEWSPVYVPVNGNIVFFYLKERSISQEPVLPQILLAQETISMDVEKKLAGELCNLMIKNEAFAVPLRTGEDQHDDF